MLPGSFRAVKVSSLRPVEVVLHRHADIETKIESVRQISKRDNLFSIHRTRMCGHTACVQTTAACHKTRCGLRLIVTSFTPPFPHHHLPRILHGSPPSGCLKLNREQMWGPPPSSPQNRWFFSYTFIVKKGPNSVHSAGLSSTLDFTAMFFKWQKWFHASLKYDHLKTICKTHWVLMM